MKPNFFRKVLKNGMSVVFEKRDIPVVSVCFAVKSGGIDENESEKGISHFIEHMLYKGTPTRNAKQIAEEIEKNGGELNGFTSELVTAYWCKMPSRHFNLALNVLSDMVKNPVFDLKEIEKERQVIFEEIKMRKDNPQIYVMDKIQSCLYEKPLGIDLIGDYKSMKSISQKDILKRFEKIYVPKNMILCVIGDANFEDIVKFAEDNFESKKGVVEDIEVKLKNKSFVEKRKGLDQANLVFAYHTPLTGDKKHYASELLSVLMAGGMSSRLFYEIREKRNLAYAVKGDSGANSKFSYNFVYVGTTKENVSVVKKIILEEFNKIVNSLDEKELNQIKEQIIGNYQISMEDSQSQMVNLLFHEVDGDAKTFYEFEKNIQEVNLEDVKSIAKKVVDEYSFFELLPG